MTSTAQLKSAPGSPNTPISASGFQPSDTVLSNPGGNFSSASGFGRITGILNNGAVGTGTPRRIQLMVRLEF